MAQEANGLVYNGSNPTGIGAVYFDKTVDPLQVHLSNMDDFAKAQAQQQNLHAQKAALGAKMLSDLDPNVNGIMDTDAGYFQGLLQKLNDETAKLYASGAQAGTPAFAQGYANLQYLKKDIEAQVQASKSQKEQAFALQNMVAQNPDKYDADAFNKALATYRLADAPTRSRYNLAGAVKQIPDDLTKLVDDTWSKVRDSIVDKTEQPVEQGGMAFTKTVESFDPAKLLGISQGFAADYRNAKSVDRTWNNLPPDQQLLAIDAAKIESNALGQEIDPKTYLVYKALKSRAGTKQGLEGGSFTPERSEAAKSKDEKDAADSAYAVINGLREMNPAVFSNVSVNGGNVSINNKSGIGNYAYSDKLSGSNYGVYQKPVYKQTTGANGVSQNEQIGFETTPNKIVSVRVDPANRNIMQVRTEEDVFNDNKKGTTDNTKGAADNKKDTTEPTWRTVPAEQFENVWFSSNFKDAPTGYQRLKEAAKKYGDVTKQGLVDPTQTVTTQTRLPQAGYNTTQYQPKGYTDTGTPYGKVTPDEWNSKWENLKKGEKLVGLDGKTYTKQ